MLGVTPHKSVRESDLFYPQLLDIVGCELGELGVSWVWVWVFYWRKFSTDFPQGIKKPPSFSGGGEGFGFGGFCTFALCGRNTTKIGIF